MKCEPEPGLGNGGLGRLAACFLDSLYHAASCPRWAAPSAMNTACSARSIVDGYQVEVPDNWLERRQRLGNRRAPTRRWRSTLAATSWRNTPKTAAEVPHVTTTTPWRPCPTTCPWWATTARWSNMLRAVVAPARPSASTWQSLQLAASTSRPWQEQGAGRGHLQGALSRRQP